MHVFSADPARIDADLVYRWLSEEAYWAKGRSRAKHDTAMANSRNYGVYDEATGAQLAYARVVTDGAFFAWLCDVFVDEAFRGHGIGTLLVTRIVAELDLLGLKRILLATADAQEVYRPLGFTELDDEFTWMARSASRGTLAP